MNRNEYWTRNAYVLITIGLLFAPLVVEADSTPAATPDGWSGKGEAGYVMSRGNVNADTGDVKADLGYKQHLWKHTLRLEALYARSADVVSAERWAGLEQSNYQFSARAFAFGSLHYEDDKFSGFVYQTDIASGVGYQFLNSQSNKLAAQVGVGYRRLRTELLLKDATGNVVGRVPGNSTSSAELTAGFDAEHDFNEATKLTDKLLTDVGAGNTFLENDLSLQVRMSRKLSLAVAYTLRENTSPPPGLVKTDTLTTLNLVYQLF